MTKEIMEANLVSAKRKIQLVYAGADVSPVQITQAEARSVGLAIELYLELLNSPIRRYL